MAQHFPGAFRGGYTLYTREDLHYGAFPAYSDGGPAMVVVDGWSVSTTSGDGIDGVICGARKTVSVAPYRSEPHDLDGKPFPTHEAAMRAQYEAGLIAYMVYENSEWAAQLRSQA